MAAPGVLGTTSPVNGAGAVTVDFTGVTASGAQLWIFFRSANEPISAPAGWTDISDTDWGTGTAGTADGVRLQLFKMDALADGTETTVATADSGSSNWAAGVATDPADIETITASNIDIVAYTTTPSFPDITTTGADREIWNILANDSDALSSSGSSGETNASLSGLTEHLDGRTNAGNGGGITLIGGTLASAGATGATTCTYASSASGTYMVLVTLALYTPSSGFTGTGAATLSALTGAATGTFYGAFTGTGAATLGALTGDGAGWITITGTADATLAALTAAATGDYTAPGSFTGTADASIPSLTGDASGTFYGLFTGTAGASLAALTGDAAGWITVTGTAAGALPSLTASATGTIVGGDPWSVQAASVDIWSTQSAAAGSWDLQTAAAGTWTVQ